MATVSLECWADQAGEMERWLPQPWSWKAAGPGLTPAVQFELVTSVLCLEEARGPLRGQLQ